MMNKDPLFDVSYMAVDYFSMVPYKTLLRILNGLEIEEILAPVSKGVYYIQGDESFELDTAIRRYYVDNCNGMFYGYKSAYESGECLIRFDVLFGMFQAYHMRIDAIIEKTMPGFLLLD